MQGKSLSVLFLASTIAIGSGLLPVFGEPASARARAVVNYLISVGVSADRLSSRAAGATDLLSIDDDETALALNPAALGRLRDVYLTLADPVASLGSQDDQVAGGSAKIPDLLDPQKALNDLNNNPDMHVHGMGEIFPSIE